MERNGLGQIIGAAGVVLSLLFVGYEIRQNTAVARTAAYHAIMADQGALLDVLATDPVLAGLLVRGGQGEGPDAFTDEELFRIGMSHRRNVRSWEGLFFAVQEKVLPPEALETVGKGRAFSNPFFRSIWPDLRPAFAPDFVEFFEALPWNAPG